MHLIKNYLVYWRKAGKLLWEAFGSYKSYLVTLIVLGIVANGLEAIGINILIPLFSFFGGDRNAVTDPISRLVVKFFDYVNLPYTLVAVLSLLCLLFIVKAAVLFTFGY